MPGKRTRETNRRDRADRGERAGRGDRGERGAERCVFCQLGDLLERRLERHSGVFEHLATAKREALAAVREFVDNELDSIEKTLAARKKRGKRVTRIEVQE